MVYVFENEDLKILDLYINDAEECLGILEKELLKLEIDLNNIDLLNDILRRIHIIKGGASFLGVIIIRKLTYAIEQVLENLKSKMVEMSTSLMDDLIKGIDLLGSFIYDIQEKLKEVLLIDNKDKFEVSLKDDEDSKDLIKRLQEIIERKEQDIEVLQENYFEDNGDNISDIYSKGKVDEIYGIDMTADLVSIETYRSTKKPSVGEHNNTNKNSTTNSTNPKSNIRKDNDRKSIRVSQEKLDNMMNMIAELMVTKNAFMHISKKIDIDYSIPKLSKEIKEVGASVSRISNELQNTIMSIRMVQVKSIFQKMPRVIRDVCQTTNKKINLITEGENTEIDKTIIEKISDPLVHIIRNSADHGIESCSSRIEKGKSEQGTIYLRAYNKNKHVYIEIEDDGKGIDPEQIKISAVDKALLEASDAEKMNKNQLLDLVFLPGFSTSQKVTEISGRGVGMDVVKSNIADINGAVYLDSEVGKGTKVTIQLPLTLAVSRGLLIESSTEQYILPIENVVETVKIPAKNIYEFSGKYFTYLRGEVVAVDWLRKILVLDGFNEDLEELNTVIISNGVDKMGIIVDKFINEQEFIVKPLVDYLASIPGISGSTLLGNGQVVIILNAGDIIKLAGR
ncbi:chemotaxis protein CheA [Clostridium magnum]|uniref:Chemotaxis protein CheA n=1 Tax=Clostridium magnum DSM 2767 TaxID=1121326 RepID=A0A162T7Z3_9CLOT|nr:chemotaxis protein CheA [Clostridium magnum]KZL92343.1 chemotaxis protein CheA [Clostridium magnum DSM 2767]SHH12740.1 two-component system, chemotaxis family, sensor kinase CheA [Clostridium magnum DSM 2767]